MVRFWLVLWLVDLAVAAVFNSVVVAILCWLGGLIALLFCCGVLLAG